jgi:MYXO-CTERM domain-containing protein
MSVNSKGTRRLVGLLAGLGVVGLSAVAQAATVQLSTGVLLVKQSSNEKVSRGTGAGILMPRLEMLSGNKLLAIWMDSAPDSMVPPSNASDNNGYWEGKTAIIQLSATAAPQIMNTQQITTFDGDRPFNHPRLASAGDYVMVAFASTIEDPNTTNEYVMILDDTGKVAPLTGTSLNGDNQVYDDNNQLQPVLNVGQNDGDNHGASEMHYIGKDAQGVDHFIGGYLHNNNDSYAFGMSVTKTATGYKATQDWSTLYTRPANIGRPTIAVTSPTTATACAAKGNNRPPEIGIQCVTLNTMTGQITNKALVAPSQPDQKVYMNQPTITALGNGICGLGVVMSDGQGRNRNGHFLGSNTSMAYTIDCNTLEVKNTQSAVAPFQRHATMTSSVFGNQGQTFMGSLGCSSTGAGGAGLQLISVDSNGMMSIDKQNNMMPVMWQCDTAWLSYKGLRNPRDQGRDFLHTLGNVPNPGFQNPHGWMPEVSNFAVSLVPAVNSSTDIRNSLFMSFAPIAWDKSVTVTMGEAVPVSQIPAGPSPTSGGTGPIVGGSDPNVNGNAGGGGGGGGGPVSPGGHGWHNGYAGADNGSGGCSVTDVGNASEDLGGLALLGLGLVAASRRRARRNGEV